MKPITTKREFYKKFVKDPGIDTFYVVADPKELWSWIQSLIKEAKDEAVTVRIIYTTKK